MTTNSGTLQAQFFYIAGQNVSLKMKIPKPDNVSESLSNLRAIFAVDKSGSMSGQPISDARGALLSLIKKFQQFDVPVSVYAFNSSFKFYTSQGVGHQELYQQCESINAGGGTAFTPVIKAQLKEITEGQYENVFIVWLSDGQAEGVRELTPLVQEFQQKLENCGVSGAVHSIGFGSGHDAEVLTAMTKCGTRPGTFQFVPEGGRIPIAVNNVFELAFESSVYAKFYGNNGATTRKVILEDSDDPAYYQANIYVTEDDTEEPKLELYNGEQVTVYDLELQSVDITDFKELVITVASFVSHTIKQATEGKNSLQQLISIRDVVDEMEQRLHNLKAQAQNLKVLRKKQIEPFIDPSLELIAKYREVVGYNQQLDNVQLAEINNLANKTQLKLSLEKKIKKKAGQNWVEVNQSEELIQEVQTGLNVDQLRQQFADADSLGKCALSGKNWVDLLAQGDCLCLTFEVDRPKGGLIDPLLFSVLNVNECLLGADVFMNSALFLGKVGMIIEGNSRYTQDEAPKPANSYEPSLGNYKVNAILPLYINQQHWMVAQHRLRALLGWSIVVDVLAFEQVQAKIIPFMLLAKTIGQYGPDHALTQLVKDTCLQIYRENKQEILAELQPKLDVYADAPSSRLTEEIPNNQVFLCQMHCAIQEGDVDGKFRTILPKVFEEELRRNASNKSVKKTFVQEILGINMEEFTSQINLQQVFEEFKQASAGQVSENKIEDSFKFEGKIENLNENAIVTLDKINSSLNDPNSAIGRLVRIFPLFGENPYNSISDAGLIENEQVLTLLIQTHLHYNDTNRKDAIESGKFTDCFNTEAATKFIQDQYTQAVVLGIKNFKANALKELTNINEQNAVNFAMTDDLAAASQYLHGLKVGNPLFFAYFRKLALPNTPYVLEKIKMLTSGQYQGQKLIFDRQQGKEFITWAPNKKALFKVWTQHHDVGTLQQWQEAIPEKAEYLQRQEARRNGEFVPYSAPKKNCKDTRHLWDEKKKRRKQHFEDVKKRGKGMKKGLKVKMTMSKRQRANARPARGAARGAARGRRGYNP